MTDFAKALRILRIERGEVLKDMADKLGITSSYLSAIECGKRKMPDDFIAKLSVLYHLSEKERTALEDAKSKDMKQVEIIIPFDGLNFDQQDVTLKFARSFKESHDADMTQLIENMRNFLANKENN